MLHVLRFYQIPPDEFVKSGDDIQLLALDYFYPGFYQIWIQAQLKIILSYLAKTHVKLNVIHIPLHALDFAITICDYCFFFAIWNCWTSRSPQKLSHRLAKHECVDWDCSVLPTGTTYLTSKIHKRVSNITPFSNTGGTYIISPVAPLDKLEHKS